MDEQLFPSKCRCPFTQFMASKPDKYGPKYWLAVDKDGKYVVIGFSYVGRDETRFRDERVSDQVVMRLLKPYFNKGRNVTTDNYFTSIKLATELRKYKTSLLETVDRIRKEVPAVVKHIKEPLYSTMLHKSDDVTITVCQGKVKKMWQFSVPSTKTSLLLIMAKRHQKVSKLTMIHNMALLLWIKWQGNTRLELPPEDGLFIRSKTHWTWRQ